MLNFYTWIQFKLENDKKAKETNDEALTRTYWKNITSIVSRAYILWTDGDDIEAKHCLAKVEVLKKSSEGDKLMTEVEAEMVYAYSRLGGAENLTHAIELYTKVLLMQPDKYFWK
ncbi:unnamed protein product [Lymnaea stagnalis]|uniref:Uncharacterized protein n=1 Tax=Lymnaea stagnalis TaxID=6523 RepID=A0AAV2IP87_LYMST